jgi:hypothetical protein
LTDTSVAFDAQKLREFGDLLRQEAAEDESSSASRSTSSTPKPAAAAAEEEARWKKIDERQETERRRQLRALWFEHWSILAKAARERAEEYERRAEELCQG